MAGLAPHSSGGYGGGVGGGGQDDYGFMSVAASPSGTMNPQGGMFSQADLRAPETDEDYENEPPLLEGVYFFLNLPSSSLSSLH